jgi:hypothetical protein
LVNELVYFRFQMADAGGRVGGFGGEDLGDEGFNGGLLFGRGDSDGEIFHKN